MKHILFISVFLASSIALAECFVVRDEADPSKWAVITAVGFTPPNSILCPPGAEPGDGPDITVSGGKATLDTSKKASRLAAEVTRAQAAKVEEEAKRQEKLSAKAEAKAIDPKKIKTLDDAALAIEKLQKAID
jgi:hypothetical protein